MILYLTGRMDSANAGAMLRDLGPLVHTTAPISLTVDLAEVTYVDDFGVLVLIQLRHMMRDRSGSFSLIHVTDRVREILSLLHFDDLTEKVPLAKKQIPNIFVRLGDATLRHVNESRYLTSFTGSVFLALLYVCRHPRSLRRDDTLLAMQRTGVDALPIVGLISFLLGLIIAFMSSVQLRQFGADIYVASLVSLAMTRELGPIMTAIIVAGRSGSAYAAEIGTMRISEEIDALFTMGFDPTRFLAVPKIVASLIVVPLLTLFSDVFAILGGLVVGVLMLDLTANAYIAQTFVTLAPFDVFLGVLKSAVFAFLISWIGCFRGFRVRGGAAGVGEATTSAVVSSIFLIILTDSVFSVILRYWG
ncbi:MAG TPA: MlaE family lipid ABC transporter permease subunit [Desulfatiglandales bacterium]|nr:MlaE family lipid ABC transporter permease subunit [Desulfatiglandales bacterium]